MGDPLSLAAAGLAAVVCLRLHYLNTKFLLRNHLDRWQVGNAVLEVVSHVLPLLSTLLFRGRQFVARSALRSEGHQLCLLLQLQMAHAVVSVVYAACAPCHLKYMLSLRMVVAAAYNTVFLVFMALTGVAESLHVPLLLLQGFIATAVTELLHWAVRMRTEFVQIDSFLKSRVDARR
eukprot:scaffold17524_cov53-Prasinocladus_malaysianus.AAC.1